MVKVKTAEDLKNFPEADLVTNYIIDRWKKGLYTLGLVGGLPGSGKSSTCIRIGELINKKLEAKKRFTSDNIIDNFLDLIKFVKNADPSQVNVGVIEEVSVLFPSRRAMSTDNVDVAKLLDTCRKKQVILLANAPTWPSIDSHIRTMANVYVQTVKVYKKAQLVYSKCYKLQTNPATGKCYIHNFKRGKKDVNRMYTIQPSKEIWDKYEENKDSFMQELYEKAEAKQIDRQHKEEKLKQKHKPVDTNRLTAKEIFVHDETYNKDRKKSDIAKDLGVSPSMISKILQSIQEKKTQIEGDKAFLSKKKQSETN